MEQIIAKFAVGLGFKAAFYGIALLHMQTAQPCDDPGISRFEYNHWCKTPEQVRLEARKR